jgi:hypothetical protein
MAEAHLTERLAGGATEHRKIMHFRGEIFDLKMIHLAMLQHIIFTPWILTNSLSTPKGEVATQSTSKVASICPIMTIWAYTLTVSLRLAGTPTTGISED